MPVDKDTVRMWSPMAGGSDFGTSKGIHEGRFPHAGSSDKSGRKEATFNGSQYLRKVRRFNPYGFPFLSRKRKKGTLVQKICDVMEFALEPPNRMLHG